MSAVRGVRGAITVERDEASLLLDATERLLREIVAENGIDSADVASALFTLTPDLCSQFPAAAARRMGWTRVPLLNFTEIAVPDGLPRVIRVLLHVESDGTRIGVEHVYLGGAQVLRPDLELHYA